MFLLLVVNSVQAVMLCRQLKVVSSSHRKMGGDTLEQTTLLNYMLYAAFVTHRTGCWSSVSVFSSFFF